MDSFLKNAPQQRISPSKGVVFHYIFQLVSESLFLHFPFSSQAGLIFRVIKSSFKKGIIFICTVSFSAYADSPPDKIFIKNTAIITSPTNDPPDTVPVLSDSELSMFRQVILAAFTFMTPRLMQAHNPQELSLWGLGAFTTRDPNLSITEITSDPLTEEKKSGHSSTKNPLHKLVTLRGNKLLVDSDFPADMDYHGWAELVVSIIQKEWDRDPTLHIMGKEHLLSLFFSGIFDHLDPYSRYLPPDIAQKEHKKRQGTEYSLGLTLTKKPGLYPVIDKINANSLIWASGADIGQKIYEINGHNTARLSLDTINSWLVRTESHKVTVKYGMSLRKAKSVTLQLERLASQTASLERQKDGYLILRITDFSTQTADEVSQLLSNALPVKGLILDLRGNKGGVMQQAVMTAALFLDRGIIATTIGRNPAANHVWAIQGGDITDNAPLVILVDGLTASASEVLAAALADHRRAVIIGSATYGKGLVQDIGQMPNGGELFITWSRNIAPLGEPLQGLGVIPQLCTSPGAPGMNEQILALKQGRSLQSRLITQSRSARDDTPLDTLLKIRLGCPANLEHSAESMSAALHILATNTAYQTALRSVPSLSDASP